MRKTFALIGAATVALTGAAHASTINTSNATCIAGCAGTTSGTTPAGIDFVAGLNVGTIYSLDNPSFVDEDNVAYDARVEVIGLSDPAGTGASSINVTGVNEWMHLRFTFVVDGSLSTLDTNGVATSVKGAKFINVFDIDSNPGASGNTNFTDVVGIDYALVGLGNALEKGGFLVAPSITPPPTIGGSGNAFEYARLDQEFVPGNEWENEPNYKPNLGLNEEDFVATYSIGGDLETFDLVWGSTGVPSGAVPAFEISVDSQGVQVPPIPLPATLPLMVAGLGLVGALRRRKAAA